MCPVTKVAEAFVFATDMYKQLMIDMKYKLHQKQLNKSMWSSNKVQN